MKIRRNMFLEVSKESVLGIEFSKNIILNKVVNIVEGKTYYSDGRGIKDFQRELWNKNLYVLVEGETIYIKMITLPIVKKYLINDLIKNELRYYYKDIDHIAFIYKFIKKDKINMEILVFCLKGNNLNILESCINNNIDLKKVSLIQFCFKDYYCNKINEINYIFVFNYNCYLYFLICHNNEIVANTIISTVDLLINKFSCLMDEFLEQYNDITKICKKIYYANIQGLNNEIEGINIKGLNINEFKYLALPYVILEDLSQEDLLKYVIIKG